MSNKIEAPASSDRYNVYSKLAASVAYSAYGAVQQEGKGHNAAGSVPRRIGSVTIHGGAGVANQKSLETRLGVLTVVSGEELEILNSSPIFLLHKANGEIFVEAATGSGRVDVEERVAKLLGETTTDPSAPMTPEKPNKTAGGAKPTAAQKE